MAGGWGGGWTENPKCSDRRAPPWREGWLVMGEPVCASPGSPTCMAVPRLGAAEGSPPGFPLVAVPASPPLGLTWGRGRRRRWRLVFHSGQRTTAPSPSFLCAQESQSSSGTPHKRDSFIYSTWLDDSLSSPSGGSSPGSRGPVPYVVRSPHTPAALAWGWGGRALSPPFSSLGMPAGALAATGPGCKGLAGSLEELRGEASVPLWAQNPLSG